MIPVMRPWLGEEEVAAAAAAIRLAQKAALGSNKVLWPVITRIRSRYTTIALPDTATAIKVKQNLNRAGSLRKA